MFDPNNFAKVNSTEKSCNNRWFNQYGAYIIETIWNNNTRRYEVIKHPFNMPSLGMFEN